MKLLVVLISYNRLRYTKRTLRNFRNTISDDTQYYMVAVDNASSDNTQEYLLEAKRRGVIDKVVLNPENYFPGKAANIGWEAGLRDFPEAQFLMRLDNDMQLRKGWDKAFFEYFKAIPELGQLGYDHEAIENPSADVRRVTINGKTINEFPGCVGGPCIIRRRIWDDGIRYDEEPWNNGGFENIIHDQEDYRMSMRIKEAGWLYGHAQEDWGRTFANQTNWHEYPDYYKQTMYARGYRREHSWLWDEPNKFKKGTKQ